METLTSNLEGLLLAIPFFVVLVLSLLLGKVVYVRTTSYQVDVELTERDNPAFGVHFALYLLGVMIAVGGTLHRGQFADLLGIALVAGFAVLCIGLLRLSIWINHRVLLREFCIYKEMITDRNAGTGFVTGGACVATGLMINGALSVQSAGDDLSERVLRALLGTLVFYVVGQGLLLLAGWVFRRITRFDVHHTIEHDDNLAAGLAYGSFLVAMGIIVRAALFDASPDLGEELVTTLIYAAIGLVLLAATWLIAARVLLPSSPLAKEVAQDRNPAAGSLAAACFICVALAFNYVIVP